MFTKNVDKIMISTKGNNIFFRALLSQCFNTNKHQSNIRCLSCCDSHGNAPNMRFVQFVHKNDHRKCLGVVSEDGKTLAELSSGTCINNDMKTFIKQNFTVGELKDKVAKADKKEITDRICLLPPITNPGKIICIGLNYSDHCEEQKKEPPKEPIFFSKLNNTLVGPRGEIIAHCITNKIDWEVELAVVIGKTCKSVPRSKALDHVFGYTIAQDITARDWQRRNGGQFLIGKSMDTFLPLGPALVHKCILPDPHDLDMICKVNGVQKQCGNTKNMIFKIDDIISRLSETITLDPGDVILTGTPAGVGMYRNPPEYLKVGDVLETEIQCMGKLKNVVVAPPTPL